MNESRTVERPERAERSNPSTRSAPDSSLRIASTAEVSRTSRDASAICPSVPPPVLEEPAYRAPLARPAKRGDGIVGDRDDSHGVPLDDPLQRRVRRDAQLSADCSRNGDLTALRHPRTHGDASSMYEQMQQGSRRDIVRIKNCQVLPSSALRRRPTSVAAPSIAGAVPKTWKSGRWSTTPTPFSANHLA